MVLRVRRQINGNHGACAKCWYGARGRHRSVYCLTAKSSIPRLYNGPKALFQIAW